MYNDAEDRNKIIENYDEFLQVDRVSDKIVSYMEGKGYVSYFDIVEAVDESKDIIGKAFKLLSDLNRLKVDYTDFHKFALK